MNQISVRVSKNSYSNVFSGALKIKAANKNVLSEIQKVNLKYMSDDPHYQREKEKYDNPVASREYLMSLLKRTR
jgi:hypothetical protein